MKRAPALRPNLSVPMGRLLAEGIQRDMAIDALATYLTGPSAIEYGIRGGGRAIQFFAMRDAFGVQGYPSQDEAVSAIRRRLGLWQKDDPPSPVKAAPR